MSGGTKFWYFFYWLTDTKLLLIVIYLVELIMIVVVNGWKPCWSTQFTFQHVTFQKLLYPSISAGALTTVTCYCLHMQLPTPIVFIGCLLSDPVPLLRRRIWIICRPIFEQINTYYAAKYFTECILNETQKENNINILNNKQIQLNDTADTINIHLAPVIRIIYIKTWMFYMQNRSWRYGSL